MIIYIANIVCTHTIVSIAFIYRSESGGSGLFEIAM